MIEMWDGGSLIATYRHRDLRLSNFTTGEKRVSVVQPPGSYQAVIRGDRVDMVQPMRIMFGIHDICQVEPALNAAFQLRRDVALATSFRWKEYNLWRALFPGEDKIIYTSPRPAFNEVTSYWEIELEIIPRFGRPTPVQAETQQEYIDSVNALDPFPLWAGSQTIFAGDESTFAGGEEAE